jgi:hypothetical protein
LSATQTGNVVNPEANAADGRVTIIRKPNPQHESTQRIVVRVHDIGILVIATFCVTWSQLVCITQVKGRSSVDALSNDWRRLPGVWASGTQHRLDTATTGYRLTNVGACRIWRKQDEVVGVVLGIPMNVTGTRVSDEGTRSSATFNLVLT